ncbi:hypothetical protein [Halalkalicoccus salilacus]|uniref:hypothetical protein n=1 Tax=Halalkalicoccus TaxID=332246 RepID=UPI002F9641CE
MPTDDSSYPNSVSMPASPSPETTGSGSNRRFNYVLLASGLFLGITGVLITVGPSIERLPAVPSVQFYSEIAMITDLLFQIAVANRALIGPILAGFGVFLGGIALGLQIQGK